MRSLLIFIMIKTFYIPDSKRKMTEKFIKACGKSYSKVLVQFMESYVKRHQKKKAL